MSDQATSIVKLDDLGVPPKLQERARILWLLTALGSLWGWIICNFIWKEEGQDENEWFQAQLKQSLFVGLASAVGYAFCGLGFFVHAGLGVLGFLTIGKGEDYEAPVLGAIANKNSEPATQITQKSPHPQRQASLPVSHTEDTEEEDAEADSGWQRDYALEAMDDFAHFDVRRDLRSWYRANKQIESTWDNREQRHAAFHQFGIRDEPHYYQVVASVERFVRSPEAAGIYGGVQQIMQIQMNAAMDDMKAGQQQRVQELQAELEPVDGITLQHWAWGQAQIAQGQTVESVLGHLQIDRTRWDTASAEWNARMSRDTTTTIATEYGKYFTGADAGQHAAQGEAAAQSMTAPQEEVGGEEPYPFERWVEISVAMEVAAEKGWDVNQVLGNFSMTAADWGVSSGWWSQRFHAHAYDKGMLDRYNQLREYYEDYYRGHGST